MSVLSGKLSKLLALAVGRKTGIGPRFLGALARQANKVSAKTGIGPRFIGALGRVVGLTRRPSASLYSFVGSLVVSNKQLQKAASGAWYALNGIVAGVKSGTSVSVSSVWQAVTGTVSRVITLTRTPSGTWFSFIGNVTRNISVSKPISGIAYIFIGVASGVKGASQKTASVASTVFIFTGSVLRSFFSSVRSTSGEGVRLSGSLSRALTVLKKSLDSIGPRFEGAVTAWMPGYVSYFTASASGIFGMRGNLVIGLQVTKTISGRLGFSQPRFGTEGYKEEMYYGVRND